MKRLIKTNGKILLSIWSINQPRKTRRNFNNYGNNMFKINSSINECLIILNSISIKKNSVKKIVSKTN